VLGYGPRLKRLWERARPSKYSLHDLARDRGSPARQQRRGPSPLPQSAGRRIPSVTTQAGVLAFCALCPALSIRSWTLAGKGRRWPSPRWWAQHPLPVFGKGVLGG